MELGLHELGEATKDNNRAGSKDPKCSRSPRSVLGAEGSNLQPKCKYTLFV